MKQLLGKALGEGLKRNGVNNTGDARPAHSVSHTPAGGNQEGRSSYQRQHVTKKMQIGLKKPILISGRVVYCINCYLKTCLWGEMRKLAQLAELARCNKDPHPFDAPSNFSVSVSSMMRLLTSNRIIAAHGDEEGEGAEKSSDLVAFSVKFCSFSLPFTNDTVQATSARCFREQSLQDPVRFRWLKHCLQKRWLLALRRTYN